jgi:hypothetical protein
MVGTIAVIVIIVVVGVSVLAYRYRSERGIESGITSFRRELRALAPRPGEIARPPSPERPTEGSSGVGIVPPDRPADRDDADGIDEGDGADGDGGER